MNNNDMNNNDTFDMINMIFYFLFLFLSLNKSN